MTNMRYGRILMIWINLSVLMHNMQMISMLIQVDLWYQDLRIGQSFASCCIFLDYVYTKCCFTQVINVWALGTKGLAEENILLCASSVKIDIKYFSVMPSGSILQNRGEEKTVKETRMWPTESELESVNKVSMSNAMEQIITTVIFCVAKKENNIWNQE